MDKSDKLPKEVYYYGSIHPLPQQHFLKSGKLDVCYDSGSLRYISCGEQEILRMVYVAVRDQNWNTVIPKITKEKIRSNKNSFKINYEAKYQQRNISFLANIEITGTEKGVIRFSMKGKTLKDFKRNRIGICVLHPMDCSGRSLRVIHSERDLEDGIFPLHISPHQPFKNIRTIEWEPKSGIMAVLNLRGDIFEMEDQRNWGDASFKTYSTPLDLPYPVQILKDTEINQDIELTVNTNDCPEVKKTEYIDFTFSEDHTYELPELGISRSGEYNELNESEVLSLKKISFLHYRVDLRLYEENWKKIFESAAREAIALKYLLKISLFFGNNPIEELSEFVLESRAVRDQILYISLFNKDSLTSDPVIIGKIKSVLRGNFPKAEFGGGTDAYFTELNRERIPTDKIDYVTFSLNPQVHAFDNLTLIENLETQELIVRNASEIAGGLPVHVSPVTLKPRFNPNATRKLNGVSMNKIPPRVDVRQMSLFGAGWTIGSIKYLAKGGARSVTYYETVGMQGITMGIHDTEFPGVFFAKAGKVYPLYHAFIDIIGFGQCMMLDSWSSNPKEVEGLVLSKDKHLRILLANYTASQQKVKIPVDSDIAKVKMLDEKNIELALTIPSVHHNKFTVLKPENGILELTINPFALVTVDFDK